MIQNQFFVYILQSENDQEKYYVGYTSDIEKRLFEHNSETQTYTKRYAPWKLITYVVFSDQKKATDFEKYLKSHSGRAFLKKRLF